jgi:hypothetical protein
MADIYFPDSSGFTGGELHQPPNNDFVYEYTNPTGNPGEGWWRTIAEAGGGSGGGGGDNGLAPLDDTPWRGLLENLGFLGNFSTIFIARSDTPIQLHAAGLSGTQASFTHEDGSYGNILYGDVAGLSDLEYMAGQYGSNVDFLLLGGRVAGSTQKPTPNLVCRSVTCNYIPAVHGFGPGTGFVGEAGQRYKVYSPVHPTSNAKFEQSTMDWIQVPV